MARSTRLVMLINIYTFWGRKRFLRLIDSASDPDQEYKSTRLVILIKNICTLWGRKRFLLPVFMRSETLPSACFFMGSETLPSAC